MSSKQCTVPKKYRRVRIYVDFRDLNRASAKNDFLLPHIDVLVDYTIGHAVLSLMDGYAGYNQVKIAVETWKKLLSSCHGEAIVTL